MRIHIRHQFLSQAKSLQDLWEPLPRQQALPRRPLSLLHLLTHLLLPPQGWRDEVVRRAVPLDRHLLLLLHCLTSSSNNKDPRIILMFTSICTTRPQVRICLHVVEAIHEVMFVIMCCTMNERCNIECCLPTACLILQVTLFISTSFLLTVLMDPCSCTLIGKRLSVDSSVSGLTMSTKSSTVVKKKS